MTQRQGDSHACKDWHMLSLHGEALRLYGTIAVLTQKMDRWHGHKQALLAAAAAQEILNGKEPEK